MRPLLIAILIAVPGCSSTTGPGGSSENASVIEYDPSIGTDADGLGPAWLAYGLARRLWIDSKFFEVHPEEAAYRYTFDEEVYARESMAKVWYELHQKDGASNHYLLQLAAAERAGFIREYVWACLAYPQWKKPMDLREQEFKGWFDAEIPDHQVETRASVRQQGEHIIVAVGPQAHPPGACNNLAGG